MKINPHDPAYPVLADHCQRVNESEHYPGLPIRLELAARFMATMIADPRNRNDSYHDDAQCALSAADALIAAYNESEGA